MVDGGTFRRDTPGEAEEPLLVPEKNPVENEDEKRMEKSNDQDCDSPLPEEKEEMETPSLRHLRGRRSIIALSSGFRSSVAGYGVPW